MEGSFNNKIRQYASQVLSFTSQYSETSWRAQNLVGPPSVLNIYGDSTSAWCPSSSNEDQVLELLFETSIFIHQVRIFENYNGGSVSKIEAFNQDHYETLWSSQTTESLVQTYNIFSPQFECSKFRSNQIRITLNQNSRSVFSELDAVELIGLLVDIEIPKTSLSSDMIRLLNDSFLCDLKLTINGEVFDAHKCILAIRAYELYKYLENINFSTNELGKREFRLILEYIYSDDLNEELLNQAINDYKIENVEVKLIDLDLSKEENYKDAVFDYKLEKWYLIVNNLIRFSIKFKMDRLEKLLLNFLMYKYLNLNNCLNIFMDSIDSEAQNLVSVEEVCLTYIKIYIKNIIKLDKFKLLPKHALIKIVLRI